MSALTGKQGTVYVGTSAATQVLKVRSWTANLDCDDIDLTSMDSAGVKEYAAGLTGWTIDFDALIDSAQTTSVLMPGIGNAIAITSDDGAPYIAVSGAGYIKSCKPKTDYKGEVSLSCSWQGSGAATVGITAA